MLERALPPLNAIRAFEAAARHGGFQAAADELHVSANAIGRQVKLLEEWLGLALFRRLARGVVLTEAGQDYRDTLAELFDRLSTATADLRRRQASDVLTISAMPSFAARWLIPRLGRLTALKPGLDVRIVASVPPVDFAREPVDVAIRLGPGGNPGLEETLLLAENFFPVANPALLARGPRLENPADLAAHVLLHDEKEARIPAQLDWPHWLQAVGCPLADAGRGLYFSFSHMTLQAAAEGQGVALASSALVRDDLRTGRLVRPFGDLAVSGPYAFRIVHPPEAGTRENVALFKRWALAEANSGASE